MDGWKFEEISKYRLKGFESMILNSIVSNSLLEGGIMNFVSPIRSKKEIQKLKEYLKETSERNYVLFLFGIHSGLRISDLLNLRVEQIIDTQLVVLKEKKTGKTKSFPIVPALQRELHVYLKDRKSGWIFPSRQSDRPLGRKMAYCILNKGAQAVGIKEPIGTHTLRKTFAYWAYKQGTSLELIQKILNHSSANVTLRYIGITQEQIDDVYRKMEF